MVSNSMRFRTLFLCVAMNFFRAFLSRLLIDALRFCNTAAEIASLVWGTPANVNRFRVFAALLHSTLVVGVSQTLRR